MKQRLKKRKSDNSVLQVYSLAAIPILLVILFCYVPMFGIIIAFKNYRFDLGIFGSEWIGFDNFKLFVTSNDFLRITRNTIGMNFLFIVFGTISALLVAIMLYELRSRSATKIYQTIMITPYFLSWVIVGYMAYAILHPQNGYLNVILGMFGVEPIDWYSTPKAWPSILTIASIWKNTGMDSVIYYAALMGVDESLYESAALDGASKVQRTWYVTLPSILMLVVMMTILKIGGIFRADFGLFYQLTRNAGVLYDTTDVMDTYIFRVMREFGDMGISSAAGLLQSVVGFVLVVFTNWAVKKFDPEYGLF